MLLFFTLVIAICGLLYELLIGTLSSYLIGNSVQMFSFTIGFFMTGMGIGAYLSRYLNKNAIYNFLKIELLLSVIGASSVIILKIMYVYFTGFGEMGFNLIYFFITILLGSLVGMEIPLVAVIYNKLKIKSDSIISDIFTFDYIGGLLASLLFPLLLLPVLGLYNISIFIGSLNLTVALLYLVFLYKRDIKKLIIYVYIIIGIIIYYIFLLLVSSNIENFYMKFYYKEPILESYQTKYQNIVLTKRGKDFRMYINGNIQFLSLDEKRYHEALIDWPLKLINKSHIKVLVLGGGDGLAVRNLLKHKNIDNITIVELDPEMIKISKTQKDLVKLNERSFYNKKVNIINGDAFKFIEHTKNKYDFIVADFPDPRDVYTAKLYSKEFYIGILGTLNKNGIFVTQASSAFFATKAFWAINKTIKSVFGNSLPYHRYLPSFGDWGFVLAKKGELKNESICGKLGCEYFDKDYLGTNLNVDINTLSKPKIIKYYIDGYKKYNL